MADRDIQGTAHSGQKADPDTVGLEMADTESADRVDTAGMAGMAGMADMVGKGT